MKIKRFIDNGNNLNNKYGIPSTVLINPESRDIDIIYNLNSLLNYEIITENTRSIVNISLNKIEADGVDTVIVYNNNDGESVEDYVCNQQLEPISEKNTQDIINSTDCVYMNVERSQSIPSDAVALLDNSINIADCENGNCKPETHNCINQSRSILEVPRGIINPNYPGFQHFAYILQDYTAPTDLPHSENDTTDDDNDIEMNEIEPEERSTNLSASDLFSNLVNNNGPGAREFVPINKPRADIPDILKTANGQHSIDSLYCDIENNFKTRDIIGDFNKEIEDEIKQVLNYNLNIQEDLIELKKEINDNFSKPIAKTINNISDVVNQVIKKLVETQCHAIEAEINSRRRSLNADCLKVDDLKGIDKNDFNEMIRSQPSFFVFENKINAQIADAFLSDGKDELHLNEQDYAAEKVEISVENTLKQLSSELRKIIPKLDKLRERETFTSSYQSDQVVFDGNFYQAPSSSLNALPGNSPKNECNEITGGGHKEELICILPHERDSSKIIQSEKRVPKENPGLNNVSVQKHKSAEENNIGSFDVYNIETALPKLDIDAIEVHLKAAKEAERRKRNDREEIRKRLAMGGDNDEYYSLGHTDRPGRKPSLQSRLQSGMDLQICFMNETASDNESQISEMDKSLNSSIKSLSKSSIFSKSNYNLNNHPYQTRPLSVNISKNDKISTVQSGTKIKPSVLTVKSKSKSSGSLKNIQMRESDFYILQATLQTEARMALAQAKELARIQMERERRTRPVSPVTEMLRVSMEKANAPLAPDRRRVSRHILTDMNIAQLQVIVNELHSQIEGLNDGLVRMLMARDELHMSQDAMLVDIEDLTRYFGVKEQSKKTKGTNKLAVKKLTSLVSK